MLRFIPAGRSIKFYVILSWLIPAILAILISLAFFLAASYFSYQSALRGLELDLERKNKIVARRLSAEILIGYRGSIGGVSSILKKDLGLSSVSVSKESPPCIVASGDETCFITSDGYLSSYRRIPYVSEPHHSLIRIPFPGFFASLRFKNLFWSALPIFLLLGLGIVFQRSVLRKYFLDPIESLLNTSTGEAEPRKHWPKEIKNISEKLYKSFETRDEHLFSKMTRGVFHDLRTLLHTPLCAVGLARESNSDATKKAKRLEHLLDVSERQLPKIKAIVDNTLDGTREVKLAEQKSQLSATIVSAKENLELLAQQSNTQIDVCLPEEDTGFVHDPIQLERALTNILKNGIEATNGANRNRESKKVKVSLFLEEQLARIQVEDSGPGLPIESNTAFRLLKSSKPTGSGLGLLVSKKIVEAHGGSITIAKSQGLKDASFKIVLPSSRGEISQ